MTARKRNEVNVSGGHFTGVNVVGQHNMTTTGDVLAGTERDQVLAQLRDLVGVLRAELDQLGSGADHVKAGVHAEHLSDELAHGEPDGGRVRKIWSQLQGLLTTAQFGANIAAISQAISKIF